MLAAGFIVLAGEEAWSWQDLVVVFLVGFGVVQALVAARTIRADKAGRKTVVAATLSAAAMVAALVLSDSWRPGVLGAWLVGVTFLFAWLWPARDPEPV